ncbi:efflux transporter outer membrane subunit [Azospirillum sp. RWY-5-1]|uniref:Efflux transporter outer membrane subunit n=1 Tax=Azospirillum oleiclasticum TaxID=2735135 RepID=A0ABX2T654_9PROT|nr:efflux transporter outer membrane subunit [Azospirillum oleiclasticum]NYZ12491.1 efflux transporter outer membrane subunit [Azospirillum oleiclasticum]NYZ19651.1 efflux transporter outer membrane subunit [Azospirillum oleiclasticum]
MLSRTAAPLLMAALLAGCSLIPDTAPPAVTAPVAWDSPAGAAGLWPDRAWWRAFGSAELARLMEEAQANNLDLAAAANRVRQADAQARIAGAALYPAVGLDASNSRSWTDSSRTGGRGAGSSSSRSYQGTVGAAYQVDLFGGNTANADAAQQRLLASRYDREAVALTVESGVASLYFQLLAIRDRVRLAEETLRIAESILGVLQRQVDLGAASDLELAQQRASVAQQRASIPVLQQAERETLTALAILLGRPPQGFAVEGRTLVGVTLPPAVAGLPATLLLRRPDLRQAQATLKAADLDIVTARADRLPAIDLSLRGGVQAAALSAVFDAPTFVGSLVGSLSAPLFEGGRLEAQEDQARARAAELVDSYRRAVLTAYGDVENALSATDTAERRHRFAQDANAQARVALRIVDARFRTGTVDFLNVLEAQRTVFQTDDTAIQAALDRYAAAVTLYTALGGGWDGALR